MFGPELAEIYDLIYRGRGKDYLTEANSLADLIRSRKPDASTLLDVACGTGEHLVTLRKMFDQVEGLELSSEMRDIAQRKLGDVTVHEGDMTQFHLGRTFDAVACMFSSVGYLPSTEALRSAVASMAGHLHPGGVLVIEPWWFPEQFLTGHVAGNVVQAEGHTIARVSHSRRDGEHTRMDIHYLVANHEGIRHFTDHHVITLFPRNAYEAAFTAADCSVEFLDGGPSGRGLFLGVRR